MTLGAEQVDRRRRLAEVFEDVLPEVTRDETGREWDEAAGRGGAGDDQWLREQVPPHHG